MLRKDGTANEILHLWGTPESMGAEYGRRMRAQILFVIDEFLGNSEAIFDVPRTFLVREAEKCEPFIPDACRRELVAMAEASGASYEDLLALNCLPDIDECYMQRLMQCCNIVISRKEGDDEFFAHGRNLDFPVPPHILKESGLVICRHPSEPEVEETVSVTWAGFVGTFTGCNSSGVSIGHVSAPTRDARLEGIPVGMLIRHLLDNGKNLDEARTILKGSPRTHAFNMAIVDANARTARAFETTPKLFEARGMHRGYLVVDNLCMCPRTAKNRLTYPTGVLRHARAVQLLDTLSGAVDSVALLDILGDRYDLSVAAYRKPGYPCCNTLCNFLTSQSVLFLPLEKRLLVSNLTIPAPLGEYREISFDELWGDGVSRDDVSDQANCGAARAL